ncbi:alpha/beta fold hydrolase [Persicirhabdus sediminis]|uniref:Alpha/beta fold hydrolase n=2 Tax=Persicirhabdus sediminis TaxID=454144 RepID=A0A8J7SL55_9BACT|nr:alpha/beta fold hydrolase [Persicirhabdus sediminis]
MPSLMKLHNKHGEQLDFSYHEGQKSDTLVILGHGLTGNKDRPILVDLANSLSEAGYPCLRLSYSGNGESDGKFEEVTISKEVEDLCAVLDQVKSYKRIAYIGHSMGAAVGALAAARDERIKVLVSLAGMVYTRDFIKRHFANVIPGKGNMWNEEEHPYSEAFHNDLHSIDHVLSAAKEVRAPWLLFHGGLDDVVLPKDSHGLMDVIRDPKVLVELPNAHHSFENHNAELVDTVAAWLKRHL